MTKYLITPSLLNSLHWYLKESFTKTEAEQRQEFLQTLRREETPTTPSQQKGLDFEYGVKLFAEGKDVLITGLQQFTQNELLKASDYYDCASAIGNIVKGGLWQQSVKKDLRIGNQDFLLYGRTDVIKRDTVFDIKFTSNYELGKFQDSSQHLIYLYCSDLPKFSYLVSDGKEWWREDYFNHAGVEGEIKSKVSEFLDYLEQDKEAKELYFNNWISK